MSLPGIRSNNAPVGQDAGRRRRSCFRQAIQGRVVRRSGAVVLVTLILALLAAALVAEAQPSAKVPRIGWLSPGASPPPAFWRGMHDLGYVEGHNLAVEDRLAGGKLDRLPELAADLVRLGVDLIVANGYPAVLAARQSTTTIPIVFSTHVDPVGTRLVGSLARPTGNVTGLTLMAPELAGKRLQLLKEIAPHVVHVAVLVNTANPASSRPWNSCRALPSCCN